MSSAPVEVDQDLLNQVFSEGASVLSNFGQYESISRSYAVSGKGLAHCYPLLKEILAVAPECNLPMTQIREAVSYAANQHHLNKTKLTILNWAGQRTERIITMLAHLRRLTNNQRLAECLGKTSRVDSIKVKQLVEKISLQKFRPSSSSQSLVADATAASDDDDGDVKKKSSPAAAADVLPVKGSGKKLEVKVSNASDLSLDSFGLPKFPSEEEVSDDSFGESQDGEKLLLGLGIKKSTAVQKKPATAAVKTKKPSVKTEKPSVKIKKLWTKYDEAREKYLVNHSNKQWLESTKRQEMIAQMTESERKRRRFAK